MSAKTKRMDTLHDLADRVKHSTMVPEDHKHPVMCAINEAAKHIDKADVRHSVDQLIVAIKKLVPEDRI